MKFVSTVIVARRSFSFFFVVFSCIALWMMICCFVKKVFIVNINVIDITVLYIDYETLLSNISCVILLFNTLFFFSFSALFFFFSDHFFHVIFFFKFVQTYLIAISSLRFARVIESCSKSFNRWFRSSFARAVLTLMKYSKTTLRKVIVMFERKDRSLRRVSTMIAA